MSLNPWALGYSLRAGSLLLGSRGGRAVWAVGPVLACLAGNMAQALGLRGRLLGGAYQVPGNPGGSLGLWLGHWGAVVGVWRSKHPVVPPVVSIGAPRAPELGAWRGLTQGEEKKGGGKQPQLHFQSQG